MTSARAPLITLVALAPLAMGVLALDACATTAMRDPRPDAVTHVFGGVARVPLETARDDLLVAQAYTGSGLGLALAYRGALGGGVLAADLGVGARYIVGRLGARALMFEHGLRLRHTFALGRGGDWHPRLGPALGWETDIAYYETWDDAHAYWLTDGWLGVGAAGWHRLAPCWRLELEGELALVALESRMPRYPPQKQDPLDELAFWFREPQRYRRFAWVADTQRLRIAADFWRTRSDAPVPSGWALGAEARAIHARYGDDLVVLELALRFTWMWGW